jgi:hypothetical protein
MPLTRRDFAGRSAVTGAGVVLSGSVGALATAPNALASTDPDLEREPHPQTGNGTDRAAERAGYGPRPTERPCTPTSRRRAFCSRSPDRGSGRSDSGKWRLNSLARPVARLLE